jgi:hypothetical protein
VRALEHIKDSAREMESSRRAFKGPKRDVEAAEVALLEANGDARRKDATHRARIGRAELQV